MDDQSPEGCFICSVRASEIIECDAHVIVFHSGADRIIAPRRHISRWRDLSGAEQQAIVARIAAVQANMESDQTDDASTAEVQFVETSGHMHLRIKSLPKPTLLPEAPHDRPLISGGDDALHRHLLPLIDRAVEVDVAVSFLMTSGARLVLPHLQDLLHRGGTLRVLTGDYLGVTEPGALRLFADLEGKKTISVFEAKQIPFHPKAWIFRFGDGSGALIVGSSNLSHSALARGVEWNLRHFVGLNAPTLTAASAGFEDLLAWPEVVALSHDWIEAYEARRDKHPPVIEIATSDPDSPESRVPEPHGIQTEALAALKATRVKGYAAGLVVLATGLGKTYLAAFDSRSARRILFVAHREEILTQAMATFRAIRPKARLGKYTGQEKDAAAEVVFASVQTLSRAAHLNQFIPDTFDYIVIDEFHHAAAATYRRIIDYFTPGFLLGLTATPDRTDGGDLLSLCEENLVYQCDLWEGIEQELLCPFKYYGVPDPVEYSQIPWRSSGFDEEELTKAVATQARADNALEQLASKGGKKAIGFCVSRKHADFMAEHSRANGLRAVAVHSGDTSAPRASSLKALEDGALDIVYAVDMFNEGVDVPSIDTVLMLRPTESLVIWLQQLGRGLRRSAEKSHLAVIDYIGNHRIFLTKARALLRASSGERALKMALEAFQARQITFPAGCEVTYDLEVLDLLKSLIRLPRNGEELNAFYLDFRERHGVRPTASEIQHAGFDPRRTGHEGWLNYVRDMGDLDAAQQAALDLHGGFLEELETTSMTKSYEMVVLKAMIDADAFPGSISISALADRVARLARRNPDLKRDLSVDPENPVSVQRMLRKYPLKIWSETRWFKFDEDRFQTNVQSTAGLSDMVSELVDWRLQRHLAKGGVTYEQSAPEQLHAADGAGTFLPAGPKIWNEYMRDQIPAFFGATFSPGSWNAGIVTIKHAKAMVLLVTLDKKSLAMGNHYVDHFETPTRFSWQSQSSTTQSSSRGRILSGAEPGWTVHLFIRGAKLRDGKAAPFRYAGPVTFVNWEGEKPISVEWELPVPLPRHLHSVFGLR